MYRRWARKFSFKVSKLIARTDDGRTFHFTQRASTLTINVFYYGTTTNIKIRNNIFYNTIIV